MIITEPEFRAKVLSLKEKACQGSSPEAPLFVTGPGRSGAIASVYASHLWGAAFLPFGEIPDCPPEDILVVDTAKNTGRTLRKAARRYPGCWQIAFYDEGVSGSAQGIHFWYENCVNRPGCHLLPPRATGRTGRMLRKAEELARAGRAVYVVCGDPRAMEGEFGREKAWSLGIKFESASSPGNLDLERVRLVGAHPNCVVLVDHYVIEKRFGAMLEELHRYDPGQP